MKKLLLTLADGIAMLSLPVIASASTFVNMTGVVNGTTNVRFLTSNGKHKLPALTLALLKGKLVGLGSVHIDNGSNKATISFPDIELADKTGIPAEITLESNGSVLLKVGHTLSGHAFFVVSYPLGSYVNTHAGKGTQYILEGVAGVNSAWVQTRNKKTGRAVVKASGFTPYVALFESYSSDGASNVAYGTTHYGDATMSMPAMQAKFAAYSSNSPIP